MDKYALIGYPLSHSFSPQIHNLAFKELGIAGNYEILQIEPDSFDLKILQLKSSPYKGFNITVPYKKNIIPFLDAIDPLAEKVNAVNTIKKDNGKWVGFNTDLFGFLKPIKERLATLKSILVIGAGGAANAVCFALMESTPVEFLTILNRTQKNADILKSILVAELNKNMVIKTGNLTDKIAGKFDLIINTTSAGMGNLKTVIPYDFSDNFTKNTVVYDLIYNPKKTLFLKMAHECNLFFLNGLEMLIAQAQKSFEIWTGKEFPDNFLDKDIFYKND